MPMASFLLPTTFQAGVSMKVMKVNTRTRTKMTTVAKPMEGSMVTSILAREGMMVHRDRKEKKPLALAWSRMMLGGTSPVLRAVMPKTMHRMDMLIKLRGVGLRTLAMVWARTMAVAPMARQMKVV